MYAARLNEYDEPVGESRLAVELSIYRVLSVTAKGVWIDPKLRPMTDRKWVSLHSRKRFAYPTLEEAKSSFLARKLRQIEIHFATAEYYAAGLLRCDRPNFRNDQFELTI